SARALPAAISQTMPPDSVVERGPAWAILRDVDGDLSATFDSVVAPALTAKAVNVTIRLNQGLVILDAATAKLWGGSVEAKGRANLAGEPKLSASVHVDDVAVDAKSVLFSGQAPIAGTVSLAAEGETVGAEVDALLRNLNGKGNLTVLKGSFAGADLGAVNDRLAKVKSLQDMISAIEAGSRGRTAFDTLSGTFVVAGGVVSSQDMKMRAPSGEGSASGTADLAARRVNANVRFALGNLKEAPPLGVRLQGAWEAPRVFFESGEFQSYMIQKGLSRFLKNLSGGKRKTSPQGVDEPPPNGKVKVKDVLREVLRAIPQ
ncbi:MAG: AsmA-like C-terminal region-containing protein, partial [Rhodospirillaceae bacterium]|nr:AsmA-like C-terminal region-containing protein [Rhodospirillaceae bacterium]